jgi:hypothetical protein
MTDREHPDVAPRIEERLRAICLALPEVTEEDAWVGTRWCVRKRNFAHVLVVAAGWPPAYVRALGGLAEVDPVTVLTFRAPPDDREVLRAVGHPFFAPVWFDDVVGMVLTDPVDWDEVGELVTESYCRLAPKKLVALVDRPPEELSSP